MTETSSELVVPALVDLRLSAVLALAWLVAVGASGLLMALILGESEGWAIGAFIAGALMSVALRMRQRQTKTPPTIDDLVVAPASARVEPAIETFLRVLIPGTLFAGATFGIVFLYPVIGAGLAGWLAGLASEQLFELSGVRRWEAQHGMYLRGVREKGLRSFRATREVLAQSR